MKKYLILLACLVILSCEKSKELCCPKKPLVDSTTVVLKYNPTKDSTLTKITESLEKSKNVEKNIKNVVEISLKLNSEKENLLQTNSQLKIELRDTKDSLEQVKYELKETKLKIPKKRNFLQKMLGTGKDSLEITKTDTI